MDKEFLAGITQATALTRAGRLAEATALIQRTPGRRLDRRPHRSSGTSVRSGPATDVVIEGECSEVIATDGQRANRALRRTGECRGDATRP